MEAKQKMKLSEMKDAPIKQKVNVLEALAKYKLKKQQEREQKMMDTSEEKKKRDISDLERRLSLGSVKATRSQYAFPKPNMVNRLFNTKSNVVFGSSIQERKRNIEIKGPGNTKRTYKENQMDLAAKSQEIGNCLKHDCEVGITEFVSQCQGFSAIVGHRFYDIQIHEICLDGSIVQLTTKHTPGSSFVVKRYPTEEEQLAVFEAEQWNIIEDMVKTGKPKIVEVDVTGKSTAEKKKIRRILMMKYDDVVNDTISVDGKKILKIFRKRKKNRQERQQKNLSSYTQFVLCKENHTTMEALNTIAQKLKMEPGCFTTAGTKDKKAITSQLVTVKNVEPRLLFSSMKHNASISVGNFSYTENPLRSGSLRGNRFTIALRNVIGDDCKIFGNLKSLKEMGFINYYEPQRFGTRNVPSHIVGKELLSGRWKEAIKLILDPGSVSGNSLYNSDVTKALIEYKSSNDSQKAFAKIKRNFQTIEAKLLLNLTKCGEDVLGALKEITLSRNIRVTYMRAYQCFIWNTIASKRLATYGLQPIIGDLVYAQNNNKNTNQENHNLELEKQPLIEMVGDRDACGKNGQGNHRKVIFIDENNIHNYTVHDVVLPLPGCHTVYPANQIARWYQELLQADGLTDADFSRSFKMFDLSGMYRYVVSKPFDLKWKFVHYDDPNATLIQSDRDRLINKKQLHPAIQGSKYRGLVLEFSLSAFAFANMVIREITKMDVTTEFQANFKGTRENYQNQESQPLVEDERCPIQFESRKSKECPKTPLEMEQMTEKPDLSKQQAVAAKKTYKGSDFEVKMMQSDSSQIRVASARMVPEEPLPRTIKFEPGRCEKSTSAAPVSVKESQMITTEEEPGTSKQSAPGAKDKQNKLDVTKIWLEPVLDTQGSPPAATVSSEKLETRIIKTEPNVSKEPVEGFQRIKIKEEPGTSKQSASVVKDKLKELDVNKIWLEQVLDTQRSPSTATVSSEKLETKIIKTERDADRESEPMGILEGKKKCQRSEKETTTGCLKRSYTKNIKEEQDICKTPTPNVGISLEEPQKKLSRIDIEPVIFQDHSVVAKTPLKEPKKEPIVVVNLTSDLEN